MSDTLSKPQEQFEEWWASEATGDISTSHKLLMSAKTERRVVRAAMRMYECQCVTPNWPLADAFFKAQDALFKACALHAKQPKRR